MGTKPNRLLYNNLLYNFILHPYIIFYKPSIIIRPRPSRQTPHPTGGGGLYVLD